MKREHIFIVLIMSMFVVYTAHCASYVKSAAPACRLGQRLLTTGQKVIQPVNRSPWFTNQPSRFYTLNRSLKQTPWQSSSQQSNLWQRMKKVFNRYKMPIATGTGALGAAGLTYMHNNQPVLAEEHESGKIGLIRYMINNITFLPLFTWGYLKNPYSGQRKKVLRQEVNSLTNEIHEAIQKKSLTIDEIDELLEMLAKKFEDAKYLEKERIEGRKIPGTEGLANIMLKPLSAIAGAKIDRKIENEFPWLSKQESEFSSHIEQILRAIMYATSKNPFSDISLIPGHHELDAAAIKGSKFVNNYLNYIKNNLDSDDLIKKKNAQKMYNEVVLQTEYYNSESKFKIQAKFMNILLDILQEKIAHKE